MPGIVSVVSIGEVLWDVLPDDELLGGAPFNFSVHATRLGARVAFVSAVGEDTHGRMAIERARQLGLDTQFIQVTPEAATGTVTVTLDAAGIPDFTIHRPAAYDCVRMDDALVSQLAALTPQWLYHGTLHPFEPVMRAAIDKLAQALKPVRRFYDINLRRASWSWPLVESLLAVADVVKLNDGEAEELARLSGRPLTSLEEFTAEWSERHGWSAVAVTRGASGASVRIGRDYAEVPGHAVQVADTVGAGDAFAAAFLYGLANEWSAQRTAGLANRVGALVASRAGGVPEWTLAEAEGL